MLPHHCKLRPSPFATCRPVGGHRTRQPAFRTPKFEQRIYAPGTSWESHLGEITGAELALGFNELPPRTVSRAAE
jgi:hypothetical protein